MSNITPEILNNKNSINQLIFNDKDIFTKRISMPFTDMTAMEAMQLMPLPIFRGRDTRLNLNSPIYNIVLHCVRHNRVEEVNENELYEFYMEILSCIEFAFYRDYVKLELDSVESKLAMKFVELVQTIPSTKLTRNLHQALLQMADITATHIPWKRSAERIVAHHTFIYNLITNLMQAAKSLNQGYELILTTNPQHIMEASNTTKGWTSCLSSDGSNAGLTKIFATMPNCGCIFLVAKGGQIGNHYARSFIFADDIGHLGFGEIYPRVNPVMVKAMALLFNAQPPENFANYHYTWWHGNTNELPEDIRQLAEHSTGSDVVSLLLNFTSTEITWGNSESLFFHTIESYQLPCDHCGELTDVYEYLDDTYSDGVAFTCYDCGYTEYHRDEDEDED